MKIWTAISTAIAVLMITEAKTPTVLTEWHKQTT